MYGFLEVFFEAPSCVAPRIELARLALRTLRQCPCTHTLMADACRWQANVQPVQGAAAPTCMDMAPQPMLTPALLRNVMAAHGQRTLNTPLTGLTHARKPSMISTVQSASFPPHSRDQGSQHGHAWDRLPLGAVTAVVAARPFLSPVPSMHLPEAPTDPVPSRRGRMQGVMHPRVPHTGHHGASAADLKKSRLVGTTLTCGPSRR